MVQLGISAFYHDAAACIVKDGKVLAAAEEERFTGVKHDESFPINAIQWCLKQSNITVDSIDEVCWYENPELKRDRVLRTFRKHPIKTYFLRKKYLKETSVLQNVEKAVRDALKRDIPIKYTDHHLSHAAFAYFSSTYTESAILTVDGVGEWETLTISHAKQDTITKKYSVSFPNSLGLLYSTFTAFLGFKPNEGEYKVMGLAPYGDPNVYYSKLLSLFNGDQINQKYFTWEYSDKIMFNKKLASFLKLEPRLPEEKLTQDYKNLAAGIQRIYEDKFLEYVRLAKTLTDSDNICLGGGCAYNGVANAKASRFFKNVHISFAPSDAGSAIGSCLYQSPVKTRDTISPYLGPEYSDAEIEKVIEEKKIKYVKLEDNLLFTRVAQLLASGKIIAWFQGRMEFGARALGNRSILASPRDPKMRERLNYVIKKREGFRPFAPSVLQEEASKWFLVKGEVPYMNQVVYIRGFNRKPPTVYLPAATHVDNTARVHTVTEKQNPRYYKLLTEVKTKTGFGVLLNTSFNLKDQTITLDPEQAIERFLDSEIDYLVLNNYLILKT